MTEVKLGQYWLRWLLVPSRDDEVVKNVTFPYQSIFYKHAIMCQNRADFSSVLAHNSMFTIKAPLRCKGLYKKSPMYARSRHRVRLLHQSGCSMAVEIQIEIQNSNSNSNSEDNIEAWTKWRRFARFQVHALDI